ncbi:hypothetical protein AOQ73_11880 [Bradyrhizobium pachyrhizi]|nr:hypothetical protein AOQ73_11880 [Bradyrhizobium pachyrhizi]
MYIARGFVQSFVGSSAFGHCLYSPDNAAARGLIFDRSKCTQQSKYLCGVSSKLLLCQNSFPIMCLALCFPNSTR